MARALRLTLPTPCARAVGCGRPARRCPDRLVRVRVESLEGTATTPLAEPVVDCPPRRAPVGKRPPSAAAPQDIEDRVEEMAQTMYLRAPSLGGKPTVWFDAPPVGVGQNGCVLLLTRRSVVRHRRTNPINQAASKKGAPRNRRSQGSDLPRVLVFSHGLNAHPKSSTVCL